MIQQISEADFENVVLNAQRPVLVKFTATWCGPCKMMAPYLEEVSQERTDIDFCEVDIDKSRDIALQYRIAAVPTCILFQGGKPTHQMQGAQDKHNILRYFEMWGL